MKFLSLIIDHLMHVIPFNNFELIYKSHVNIRLKITYFSIKL